MDPAKFDDHPYKHGDGKQILSRETADNFPLRGVQELTKKSAVEGFCRGTVWRCIWVARVPGQPSGLEKYTTADCQ